MVGEGGEGFFTQSMSLIPLCVCVGGEGKQGFAPGTMVRGVVVGPMGRGGM